MKTYEYELYFVGHSMGAIVLNNVLVQFRENWERNGALRSVIYMGAACTIHDAVDAIVPLLKSNKDSLRFYNLTLNRVAEISERPALGFAPSGSLLEYIDQHLENPDTAIDRTIGSEVNVLTSIHLFSEVRNKCEFKGFDVREGWIPRAHGDFGGCPFWLPSFWSKQTVVTNELKKGQLIAWNCYPEGWYTNHPAVLSLTNAVERPLKQGKAAAKAKARKAK